LYGRILKAGVETGRLSEMLTSLNRHLELASRTRRIIFEAISYPVVIMILGAIVITAMFMLVIPQFKTVLEEMVGGQLNPVTKAFLAIPAHIIPFWIALGLLIAVILAGLAILSTSATGRRLKESIFLHIPVIGRVYHSSVLGRMAEAMAMMISAGCDMPASLRLSSGATGSEKVILESETLAAQIEQGANILEAGIFCRMIPRLFLYSIQLGTQRNELQDNLYSLGQMYAEQARCGQARLQAVLLPIMLIVIGGFIAMAVLAMFLPMIQVVTALGAQG
jgi:type II secretory pathway component PulF